MVEAGVDPERRPSQATATIASARDPSAARGWRPSVMSESNWPAPAEKPSWSSSGSNAIAPSRTSMGPAWTRSPRGGRRRLLACADAHVVAVADDAGAPEP